MLLGDTFPNFSVKTTAGDFLLHDYIGNSWCVFFSHPNAFTPVCTTELARVAQLMPEFTRKKVKVIGYSCDSVPVQAEWLKDIQSYARLVDSPEFPYPVIGDESRTIAVELGMIDPAEKNAQGLPVSCRSVFIIDPSKKLRLSILYPATTGRNFDEILRVIDSLQLTDAKKVATPADWKQGGSVMVLPTLTDEDAAKFLPNGFTLIPVPSKKNYLRVTPQP